jgi:hypothetical protein
MGGEDAVRCMKRSLRRRYSACFRVGAGRAGPLEIGVKAVEAAMSLEAQP